MFLSHIIMLPTTMIKPAIYTNMHEKAKPECDKRSVKLTILLEALLGFPAASVNNGKSTVIFPKNTFISSGLALHIQSTIIDEESNKAWYIIGDRATMTVEKSNFRNMLLALALPLGVPALSMKKMAVNSMAIA